MAENKEVFEEMKKKIFFSCFSGNQAIFVNSVEELTEEQRNDKTKAFFDGMTLIDNAEEVEDDISQVFSITKDREQVNLQDYYSENGAFDEDLEDQFLEAVKNLMDKEDYDSESFDEDLDEDDEEEEHEGNWDRFKNIAFFTEYGDKEVIFHNNVKKIGEEAFVHNPNLKKVILPTGCEVDPGAFDEGVEIIYSDEL